MSLNSMTGFARIEGHSDHARWVMEARSVNGKGLDVRVRWPQGFEMLEAIARKAMSDRFARGNVQVSINLESVAGGETVALNQAMFDAAHAIAVEQAKAHDLAPPTIDGLLRLKGVLAVTEQKAGADDLPALSADLNKLAAALQQARADEGAKLAPVILGLVDTIASLSSQARETASMQPADLQTKLQERLAGLSVEGLDPQRLAQEVAILASKADVREELDRLDAHVQAARELLASAQPVGRKLDFLMQEFNREANTLCSKSSDTGLTRIGLDLKTTIEQLREQIQNVE